jgi:hypothetical protein
VDGKLFSLRLGHVDAIVAGDQNLLLGVHEKYSARDHLA